MILITISALAYVNLAIGLFNLGYAANQYGQKPGAATIVAILGLTHLSIAQFLVDLA